MSYQIIYLHLYILIIKHDDRTSGIFLYECHIKISSINGAQQFFFKVTDQTNSQDTLIMVPYDLKAIHYVSITNSFLPKFKCIRLATEEERTMIMKKINLL